MPKASKIIYEGQHNGLLGQVRVVVDGYGYLHPEGRMGCTDAMGEPRWEPLAGDHAGEVLAAGLYAYVSGALLRDAGSPEAASPVVGDAEVDLKDVSETLSLLTSMVHGSEGHTKTSLKAVEGAHTALGRLRDDWHQTSSPDATLERLADAQHEIWSHWMRWFFKNDTPENRERWKRQMANQYVNLSESEKESDRKVVREHLSFLIPPADGAE